jgi:hypothetical protein
MVDVSTFSCESETSRLTEIKSIDYLHVVVFRIMTSYSLPEDGGDIFLRNFGTYFLTKSRDLNTKDDSVDSKNQLSVWREKGNYCRTPIWGPLNFTMKKSEEKNFFDKIEYVSFSAEGVSETT